MGEKNIPDNKTRTKSALVSLSEEIENEEGHKVRNISDQLAKDGAIKIAYLGIVTDEISLPSEVGAQLEPSQVEGLILLSVEKDTAAKNAGLLMGDIIVRLDDQPIMNVHDLRRRLLKHDVIGKSVKPVKD